MAGVQLPFRSGRLSSIPVCSAPLKGNLPYTHRRYILAAAFGQAAQVTGVAAFRSKAVEWARQGLALQRPDGTNPEKDGYDAGYQMVGVLMSLRYLPVCTDPQLRARLRAMVQAAIPLELARLRPDGSIDPTGSTRIEKEHARNGKTRRATCHTLTGHAAGTGVWRAGSAAAGVARAGAADRDLSAVDEGLTGSATQQHGRQDSQRAEVQTAATSAGPTATGGAGPTAARITAHRRIASRRGSPTRRPRAATPRHRLHTRSRLRLGKNRSQAARRKLIAEVNSRRHQVGLWRRGARAGYAVVNGIEAVP